MKVIIFDFDGTIGDTFTEVLKIYNNIAPEYKLSPIQEDQIQEFKKKRGQEVVKSLHVPSWKLPFVLSRVFKELHRSIDNVTLFKGMKEVLQELSQRGYILVIITSNTQENIELFLKKNNIGFFNLIVTGSRLFGKSKKIKKVLRTLSATPEQAMYIGDETRDIEAAKTAKVSSVAVTWGYNARKALEECKPDYVIATSRELLEIL